MAKTKIDSNGPVLMQAPEVWMTKRQAALEIGVCERTIELWLKAGRLPRSRPSFKVVRIRRSDLNRFLEKYNSVRTPA